MSRLPSLRSLPGIAADAAAAAAVLARSGMVAPFVPRPELLGLIARAPFKTPSLGSAVAVHAATRPGATALIDDEGSVTWARLAERSRRLANAILGVAEPGEAVAFLLRNGRENVECYTGCGLAGMAAVPVNTWSSRSEVEHIVSSQDVVLMIADREFTDALDGLDVPVWWVGEDGDYEPALAAADPGPPPVRGGGRIVTHTSGTTGKPKGAERSMGGSTGIASLIGLLEKVPLRRSDVFYLAPPLFHQFAQGMMAVGLVLGTTMVVRRKFDAEDFLQHAALTKTTAAALLPVMLKRIADLDGPVPVPPLRLVIASGSALPPALRDRVQQRVGDVIYDLYGSTEVGFATIATPRDHAIRPGSVGRPGRASEILIVDDEGELLPAGEVGRIHVRSDFAFEGYTGIGVEESVVNGAIDIGDRGYLDDLGYLFVTGRTDDMIVSGGENIFPSEVEGVLEEHPDLADSAVVGADDDEFGQVLHAYVVARDGADVSAADVTAFVKDKLARYKAPKKVVFLDALPRNAAGKVVKSELGSQD